MQAQAQAQAQVPALAQPQPQSPAEPRPDRRDRLGPRRPERTRDRERPPHSQLVEWSPPEEADDEAPILVRDKDEPALGAAARAPAIDTATLFINAGRRDNLRPADLVRILEERGGIAAEAIARVRIRDRNSFVDVRPDVADKAIEAIKGAMIGTRMLNAEPARARAGDDAEDDRVTQPMGGRR